MTAPGIYISPAYLPKLWIFQAGIVLAGGAALLSLAPTIWFHPRVQAGFFPLALLAVFGAGVWVVRASPNPIIDTYVFQQTSSKALLLGLNPYQLMLPNLYGHMNFYGPELVTAGRMTIGNPYPPMSIYLSWLGYVVGGDIRYSHLAASLLAGVLIARLRPDREALLATYIFLFTPRMFFVVEQSWTEPLAVFLSAAVIGCARRRPAWAPVTLGLLIATKQYMIFMLPLLVLIGPPGAGLRVWLQRLTGAVATAFAVTAPLAFWNFPAFLWNVGLAQWYQVFRMDALSYAALYAHVTQQLPSQLLPFIALGAAFVLAWFCAPRSAGGFAAALALSLGLFFAFSKQAFCNYYYLVIGVLCSGLAAMPGVKLNQAG